MGYWILGAVLFIGVLVTAYLLSIRPAAHRKAAVQELLVWDYAHRGLYNPRNRVHENTMEAFALAVQNGYGMELDVQLTKDRQLIVFHDFDLFRMCGVDKRADELTYEEISRIRIKGGPSRIPLFRDVLEMVAGRAPIIIEIKSEGKAVEICGKVNELLDSYTGAYCIESFNPYIIYWYAKNRPDIVRGQLSENFMRSRSGGTRLQRFLLTNLMFNFLEKPDFIAYCHQDSGNISLRLCKGLFRTVCVAWTIKTQEEYNKARGFFDVAIFEGFLPQ